MKVSMSAVSEETLATAQFLDGEVEDADSSGVAEAGTSRHGLSLLSVEAIKESSITLRMMTTLFRVSTGLDLFLFYRCPSTGQWREKGFSEPIQLPHFCQLVRSTREGLGRCMASHRVNMEGSRGGAMPEVPCQPTKHSVSRSDHRRRPGVYWGRGRDG